MPPKNTNLKNFLTQLNQDLFSISFINFIIFFLLEAIKPKFVIAYLDLNNLLLFCLITGSIMIIVGEKHDKQEAKLPIGSLASFVKLFLSIIAFLIIGIFLKQLELWGWLIGLVGGIIIYIMGSILNE